MARVRGRKGRLRRNRVRGERVGECARGESGRERVNG